MIVTGNWRIGNAIQGAIEELYKQEAARSQVNNGSYYGIVNCYTAKVPSKKSLTTAI